MPERDVEPLFDAPRRSCDACEARMTHRVYAAYNADEGENTHPLHARYPMPMFRACPAHLGTLMVNDARSSTSTRQWLVVVVADAE
jgi:hypothetical protein